jgi:hypothetical protein
MGTTSLWVLVVVLPASASALLVVALDLRAHRRRLRRVPAPSRLTAVLGAALGAGGFGLASFAGLGPTAHAAHGPEQIWVATATAGGGVAVVPVDPTALAQLPFAPVAIWGTGFDGDGTWDIVAEVPGAAGIPLASGSWPKASGEGVRALALVDPAPIVAAARAAGVLPRNGVYTLVLRSTDPPVRAVFTLAAPPGAPAPVAAPGGVPPITGAVASAVQRRHTAAATAPGTAGAPSPGTVGVPATGASAPLLGGLAMLLAGAACAGLSLRLRRGV